MKRRQLLKSTAALSAVSALGAPAIAQAPKKITYLTWNLVHLEAPLKGWFEGFTKARPGVEIEWVDKKGPELPAYYQTQLAANTPPDVIDIQGALGLEYAAQGALLDLTPRLAAEASVKARYEPITSRTGCSRTRTTWCPTTSPRRCCSGTRRASRRRASTSRRRASTTSWPPPTRSRAPRRPAC
jgi:hypothetical protein